MLDLQFSKLLCSLALEAHWRSGRICIPFTPSTHRKTICTTHFHEVPFKAKYEPVQNSWYTRWYLYYRTKSMTQIMEPIFIAINQQVRFNCIGAWDEHSLSAMDADWCMFVASDHLGKYSFCRSRHGSNYSDAFQHEHCKIQQLLCKNACSLCEISVKDHLLRLFKISCKTSHFMLLPSTHKYASSLYDVKKESGTW
jgi:hypothetical protein